MTERSDNAMRFLALKKQAEDKVLLVSPPYADEGKRSAFLAGYESALSDIARGDLDVPEVPR